MRERYAYPEKEEMKNAKENRRWWGGGSRARRTTSYYVGNVTAEMTTLLRISASTLIRLREKMGLHLCIVFHSTHNAIALKRNASNLRMLQEHATEIQCSIRHKTNTVQERMHGSAVLHK